MPTPRKAYAYRAAKRNNGRNRPAEQLKAERKITGETRAEQDRRRARNAEENLNAKTPV